MKLAAAVALVVATASAHADDGRDVIIPIDVVSDTLMLPAIGHDTPSNPAGVSMMIGLAGHLLGAPAVHAAHGDWGAAGIDLGVRAATPLATAWLGQRVCEDHGLDSPYNDLNHCAWVSTIGGMVGVLGAQVFDWLVLARSDAHVVTFSFGGHF